MANKLSLIHSEVQYHGKIMVYNSRCHHVSQTTLIVEFSFKSTNHLVNRKKYILKNLTKTKIYCRQEKNNNFVRKL